MKLWRFDVKIAGTAYVQAETAEEALKKFAQQDTELWRDDNRFFSGSYENCPEISLAPVMTIHGPCEEPELVHDGA